MTTLAFDQTVTVAGSPLADCSPSDVVAFTNSEGDAVEIHRVSSGALDLRISLLFAGGKPNRGLFQGLRAALRNEEAQMEVVVTPIGSPSLDRAVSISSATSASAAGARRCVALNTSTSIAAAPR